jgi:hypothetical protein
MNVGYETSDHFVFNLQHVIFMWVGKMLSCMVVKDLAEMACKQDRIGGKRKPLRTCHLFHHSFSMFYGAKITKSSANFSSALALCIIFGIYIYF